MQNTENLSLACTAHEFISASVKMKGAEQPNWVPNVVRKKIVKEHVQLRWQQKGGSIFKVITCQNFTDIWSIHSNTMSDGFFCFTISWQVPNPACRWYYNSMQIHWRQCKTSTLYTSTKKKSLWNCPVSGNELWLQLTVAPAVVTQL